jgi:hypothetical protein
MNILFTIIIFLETLNDITLYFYPGSQRGGEIELNPQDSALGLFYGI